MRHPLPQGEWHAAPSYTWGSKRLNASTKRVSSGGLPPTPTWSQRRDWTRIVGASLRSRARRRRLLRRLRPCRRHVPGPAPLWTKRLLGTPLQSVFSPQLTNYRSYLGRCSEPNNKRMYAMDQIWVWGTQIYNVWFRKGLGSTCVTLKFLNLKVSSENLKKT